MNSIDRNVCLILVAPSATIRHDKKASKPALVKPVGLSRVFKTAWFAKEARKAKITDGELCRAIKQVMQGQADDLGGGVYKKRLNDNMHRQSFWPRLGNIGYTLTFTPRRIGRT
jgi:hypothetical protein